jgi:hypothetical protein
MKNDSSIFPKLKPITLRTLVFAISASMFISSPAIANTQPDSNSGIPQVGNMQDLWTMVMDILPKEVRQDFSRFVSRIGGLEEFVSIFGGGNSTGSRGLPDPGRMNEEMGLRIPSTGNQHLDEYLPKILRALGLSGLTVGNTSAQSQLSQQGQDNRQERLRRVLESANTGNTSNQANQARVEPNLQLGNQNLGTANFSEGLYNQNVILGQEVQGLGALAPAAISSKQILEILARQNGNLALQNSLISSQLSGASRIAANSSLQLGNQSSQIGETGNIALQQLNLTARNAVTLEGLSEQTAVNTLILTETQEIQLGEVRSREVRNQAELWGLIDENRTGWRLLR